MSQAQELENIQEKFNWHWRNSMQIVRFFAFDSRAALPAVILLFNLANLYIWLLFFVNLMFFRYLEQKGLTVPAAMRNFRSWIVGAERPGLLGVDRKKYADFG